MGVLESLRVALDMLRLHKMRAFLTMLGVIIGVMSVSLIIILVKGFGAYIEKQFEGLAADTIYIVYDPSRLERGQRSGNVESVTDETKEYIITRCPSIRTVSGVVETGSHTVKHAGVDVKSVKITAIDTNNNEIVKKEILKGRGIIQEDIANLSNSAVITEKVAEELFGDADPINKLMEVKGITLTVVGVMKQPAQIGGPPSEKVIEIPVTTAQRKWVGGRNYTWLMARTVPGVTVNEAMQEVWQQLMLKTNNRPVYRVDSNESILGIFGTIIGGIGIVLAGVAALSLLVGGIGIMNIMLVSVTERTREIGLRKAVGAKRGSILMQFLVEASVLSLVGGLIGMAIAFGLGQLVSYLTVLVKWPEEGGLVVAFPLVEAMMAAGFSALIGMVFGFFPAVSASRLDPIVALRTE